MDQHKTPKSITGNKNEWKKTQGQTTHMMVKSELRERRGQDQKDGTLTTTIGGGGHQEEKNGTNVEN
jgi:hypothetical protein